jgi:hypothetical protein
LIKKKTMDKGIAQIQMINRKYLLIWNQLAWGINSDFRSEILVLFISIMGHAVYFSSSHHHRHLRCFILLICCFIYKICCFIYNISL